MNKRKLDEFRGFFYADGSCTLHERKLANKYVNTKGIKKDYYHSIYTVRLVILQRIDNLPLLKEFQKEFGGYLYVRRPPVGSKSKMCAQWQLQTVDGCHKLTKILLDTQFTYRSKDAVRACYEYCDWKMKRGLQVKLSDDDRSRIHRWISRVKDAHSFSTYKGQQVID